MPLEGDWQLPRLARSVTLPILALGRKPFCTQNQPYALKCLQDQFVTDSTLLLPIYSLKALRS